MADDKVYSPSEIADTPLPQTTGDVASIVSQPMQTDVITPKTIPDQTFPTRPIAHEVIGESLNTKSKKILAEFGFTKMGALQIGQQQDGISGDIRISPNGIIGRNAAGFVTFAIDGDTGNAVFAGEIQAGSLITGAVHLGDDSIIIDGEARNIIFYDTDGVPIIVIGATS